MKRKKERASMKGTKHARKKRQGAKASGAPEGSASELAKGLKEGEAPGAHVRHEDLPPAEMAHSPGVPDIAATAPIPVDSTTLEDAGAPREEEVPPSAPAPALNELSVEQLQAEHLRVLGRPTASRDRGYLVQRIRDALRGHIHRGPLPDRTSGDGEMHVIVLRIRSRPLQELCDAWKKYQPEIRSRNDLMLRALAHYVEVLRASPASTQDQ